MFRMKSRSRKTRYEVATPKNIRFIEPAYRTISSKSQKLKKLLFWGVLSFCFLRIIFMDGGYLELKEKQKAVQDMKDKLSFIKNENKELVEEIKKIKSDKNYQKKLAREHLDVIGSDEFLILFASDLEKKSR
ncbi:MAG: septum formation initiator family protein [Halobacteriovoraceae bacterium]|nr:septum formation initiator family protein [Halobacteriovoraceae bacterium]MCB9095461.1 septum formation initiator family protein [Halobacteriovoraceae bacterium]